MTILRSIDFSRATASAICNSSSRFALIPACAILVYPPLQCNQSAASCGRLVRALLLGAPQRLANELVRQHQTRLGDERDRQADDLPAQLIELDLDAHLVAFDALEHAAKPLAALDRLLHLDLGLVARPVLEIGWPHQRPVDARRGNLERVAVPASGRAHRAPATARREISAHSSMVIVPSGRSAMICTVAPLRPETTTRTRRKPRSASTGSASAAISPAKPVSPMKRASDAAPLTAHSPARFKLLRLEMLDRSPKTKRADPQGPLSELR